MSRAYLYNNINNVPLEEMTGWRHIIVEGTYLNYEKNSNSFKIGSNFFNFFSYGIIGNSTFFLKKNLPHILLTYF